MRAGPRLILTVLLVLILLPAIALAEPSEPLAPAENAEVVIGEHPDGILFSFTEPQADTYRIDVLISGSPALSPDGRFGDGIVAMGGTSETTTPGVVYWTLEREAYAPDAGTPDMPAGTYYWQTDSQQPCGDADICHVYGPVRSFRLVTSSSQPRTPTSGTSGTSGTSSGTGSKTSSGGSTTATTTAAKKAVAKKKAAAKKRAAAKKAKRCKTLIKQKKLAKAKRLGCKVPKKAPAKRS